MAVNGRSISIAWPRSAGRNLAGPAHRARLSAATLGVLDEGLSRDATWLAIASRQLLEALVPFGTHGRNGNRLRCRVGRSRSGLDRCCGCSRARRLHRRRGNSGCSLRDRRGRNRRGLRRLAAARSSARLGVLRTGSLTAFSTLRRHSLQEPEWRPPNCSGSIPCAHMRHCHWRRVMNHQRSVS